MPALSDPLRLLAGPRPLEHDLRGALRVAQRRAGDGLRVFVDATTDGLARAPVLPLDLGHPRAGVGREEDLLRMLRGPAEEIGEVDLPVTAGLGRARRSERQRRGNHKDESGYEPTCVLLGHQVAPRGGAPHFRFDRRQNRSRPLRKYTEAKLPQAVEASPVEAREVSTDRRRTAGLPIMAPFARSASPTLSARKSGSRCRISDPTSATSTIPQASASSRFEANTCLRRARGGEHSGKHGQAEATGRSRRLRAAAKSAWSGLSRPWARRVSNLRPLACEASALPLSYAPWCPRPRLLVSEDRAGAGIVRRGGGSAALSRRSPRHRSRCSRCCPAGRRCRWRCGRRFRPRRLAAVAALAADAAVAAATAVAAAAGGAAAAATAAVATAAAAIAAATAAAETLAFGQLTV